ncbi:TauD/TfdA family dioxygenase [Streptomyces olivoreticuli]
MEIRQLTPFIGSGITGVTFEDLQHPDIFGALHDTLRQRELIVVRDLTLTPEQQVVLARKIGKPVPFPDARYGHPSFPEVTVMSNVVKGNKPVGAARAGNYWHQDSSFMTDPPAYSMLYGVDVPHTSGHTLYANACDVYDRLPDPWKTRIDGRTAVHTFAEHFIIGPEHAGLSVAELRALIDIKHPAVEQPLVRCDAFTGRPYLYGAPEYLRTVNGFDANQNEEFRTLLDHLIRDPEHIYTHRWLPKDLMVWKTATAYHAATPVEPGVDRTVHRISIDAPS